MALTVDESRRRGEFLVASSKARDRGDFAEAVRLYDQATAVEEEARRRESETPIEARMRELEERVQELESRQVHDSRGRPGASASGDDRVRRR